MIEEIYIDYIKYKIIDIVKNNNPKKSLLLISKIKLLNNKIIGQDKALDIYIRFSDYSVKYDRKTHEYNGTLWANQVNKNIYKAKKKENK
jgi:hypothetical protein